jgi:hypothetical protein
LATAPTNAVQLDASARSSCRPRAVSS